MRAVRVSTMLLVVALAIGPSFKEGKAGSLMTGLNLRLLQSYRTHDTIFSRYVSRGRDSRLIDPPLSLV